MNQIKTVELAKVVNWGLLTFVMFWTGLVILCSLYMTIPLLSVFAEEFTITANQAAWAGSIFSIFFAIGCVFFGIMSEKFGLKRVMVFGILCLGALTILVGFASDFRQLLIFRALQGIASATFSPVAITYIGKVFPHRKTCHHIGIFKYWISVCRDCWSTSKQLYRTKNKLAICVLFFWCCLFYYCPIVIAFTSRCKR